MERMKAMAAVMAFVAGEPVNVSRACAQCGISRKTFYKYAARCRAEGPSGFEPRSRRAHRFPAATAPDVEDLVVELRKELADAGLDHGATTIQWHLARRVGDGGRVPSMSTIHRILRRRGFVTPQPAKRPKSSWRSFQAPAPNELWQIDATDWATATGKVKVFNIIDDHSRLACRSRAVDTDSSAEAWTTFCQAAQRWGLPSGVLSDNGLCFSGKLRGFEVEFEARLRDAGIRPITGRPYHPQTTGKVERFQQTLKNWLRHCDERHDLARTAADLQARLDTFVELYNTQRPHQGIGRVTPSSRWHASRPSRPGTPLEHPTPRATPRELTVGNNGILRIDRYAINVGIEWTRCHVTVIFDGTHATVFHHGNVIRHLELDLNRSYQPSGRLRGGPRHPRHLTS
jgi:transposase InsO family protein